MRRRRFLTIISLGGIAVSALAGALGVRWYGRNGNRRLSDEELARAIRDHFGYLQLDEGEVLEYARQGRERYGDVFAPPPEAVYVNFLMSTDFFDHDADESRRIAFKRIYDPHDGCRNPFAQFE